MTEEQKKHIKALLTAVVGDAFEFNEELMGYIFTNEVQSLCNRTNRKEVPSELVYIAEERTAGELLRLNKSAIVGEDGARVAKSIKQGDVSFEFTGESNGERLDHVIGYLGRNRDAEVLCYRTIKW